MRLQTVVLSSSLSDTPESLFVFDRLSNFNYGHHGDIEIYNDPMLLAERELEQRIQNAVLYGTDRR